jgi:hypothetical protein
VDVQAGQHHSLVRSAGNCRTMWLRRAANVSFMRRVVLRPFGYLARAVFFDVLLCDSVTFLVTAKT